MTPTPHPSSAGELVTEHRCPALLRVTALRLAQRFRDQKQVLVKPRRAAKAWHTVGAQQSLGSHSRCSAEQRTSCQVKACCVPSSRSPMHAPSAATKQDIMDKFLSTQPPTRHERQEGPEMWAQTSLALLLIGVLPSSLADSEEPRLGRTLPQR